MNKAAEREQAAKEKRYWLKISNVCNNRCLFCLDSDPRRTEAFEPLARLEQEIHRAAEQGAERLVVSGGEPSIHPAFTDILKLGQGAGFKKIQAISNGRMFSYKSFAHAAVKAGLNEATFSIHGHNASLHDRLCGTEGAFAQAVAGIRNLKAAGNCIVNIDVVVNKLNYRHIPAIMETFMQLGIGEFDLLYPIPFGRARRHWEELAFNYPEAIPYLKQAFALRKARRCFVWTNRFPAHYLEDAEELIQEPAKLYDEVQGRADGFAAYRQSGVFYCEGAGCGDCFIRGFCAKFRFYAQPSAPAFVIAGSLEEALCTHRQPSSPAMVRTRLTPANLHTLFTTDSTALPGTVIFEVPDEAAALLQNLRFPAAPACFLELSSPLLFAAALKPDNAMVSLVLNRTIQEFILAHSSRIAEHGRRLVFRIPCYSDITAARQEYSHLSRVLTRFPAIPVFGSTPCLSRESLCEPAPSLDLNLTAGAAPEQLRSLVQEYITRDYLVKSVRCAQCRAAGSCRGMHINFIRCFGFRSLHPLTGTPGAEVHCG